MAEKKYLTVSETSEITGFSNQTIYKWLARGLITKRTFNGYNVAIDREELEGLIKVKEA